MRRDARLYAARIAALCFYVSRPPIKQSHSFCTVHDACIVFLLRKYDVRVMIDLESIDKVKLQRKFSGQNSQMRFVQKETKKKYILKPQRARFLQNLYIPLLEINEIKMLNLERNKHSARRFKFVRINFSLFHSRTVRFLFSSLVKYSTAHMTITKIKHTKSTK